MAGSVTLSSDSTFPKSLVHTGEKYQCVREVVFSCVGDASSGSIPDTNLCHVDGLDTPLSGWGLWALEIVPGATGPSASSDVYLKSADGTDFLDGYGVDGLNESTNKLIYPQPSIIPIGSTLTLDIDNQSVASATYKVKLYLIR